MEIYFPGFIISQFPFYVREIIDVEYVDLTNVLITDPARLLPEHTVPQPSLDLNMHVVTALADEIHYMDISAEEAGEVLRCMVARQSKHTSSNYIQSSVLGPKANTNHKI